MIAKLYRAAKRIVLGALLWAAVGYTITFFYYTGHDLREFVAKHIPNGSDARVVTVALPLFSPFTPHYEVPVIVRGGAENVHIVNIEISGYCGIPAEDACVFSISSLEIEELEKFSQEIKYKALSESYKSQPQTPAPASPSNSETASAPTASQKSGRMPYETWVQQRCVGVDSDPCRQMYNLQQ